MINTEDYIIIPLSKKYLKQGEKLLNATFKDEDESLSKEIEASIDEEKFKKYVTNYDTEVCSLEYYIAVDKRDNVNGIIGLYSLKQSYEDTYWVGWFCVDKNQRGKGIGSALLDYVTEEARRRKRKYLCLYTSTDKNEAKAQILYDNKGFIITRVVYKKGYEILFRKKTL